MARSHQGAVAMANRAITDAMNLVGAVRILDPADVWRELAVWRCYDPTRLYAVVTALAAMVDDTRRPSQMLAWIDGPTPLQEAA